MNKFFGILLFVVGSACGQDQYYDVPPPSQSRQYGELPLTPRPVPTSATQSSSSRPTAPSQSGTHRRPSGRATLRRVAPSQKTSISIPFVIDHDDESTEDEEEAIAIVLPQGRQEQGKLCLKLDAQDPLIARTYRTLIAEKHGMPFIVAVVKTREIKNDTGKEQVHIVYRVFEAAALHKKLEEQNFKNRYVEPASIVTIGKHTLRRPKKRPIIKDPLNQQEIDGPIYYFVLLDSSKPFIALGSDRDYLQDPQNGDDTKKRIDYAFAASGGDSAALNMLGVMYKIKGKTDGELERTDKPNLVLAEYCFKKYLEINPISKEALFNLGVTYVGMREGKKSEYYLKKAISNGSSRAYYTLGVLHEEGASDLPRDINKAIGCYREVLARVVSPDIKELAKQRLQGLGVSIDESDGKTGLYQP